ncbi:hypothetical protein [Burkholderia ambifaria]|uniref:hypothetical protein n=1 Tax=Burkholderia ambifaria TaxID=152480 RepID=UPI002FE39E95
MAGFGGGQPLERLRSPDDERLELAEIGRPPPSARDRHRSTQSGGSRCSVTVVKLKIEPV